ncbi:MAG: inner membrane-spanning protein YciB [Hyphomicrobiaceae bacterium]
MKWLLSKYPFNAEQTVNILGEFGPLVALFVVNALAGVIAGTWALIIATGLSVIAMKVILGRLPIFPLIASLITVLFGVLTLVTGDPMWIIIKVTIFNIMFAIFLFVGLWMGKNFFKYIFERTFHYTQEGWDRFTWSFAWFFVLTAVLNEAVRLGFPKDEMFNILGYSFDGVNVWVLFKVFFIMPLSGLYAWYLTRLMHRYRVDVDTPQTAVQEG